jgi:hypothetical protein
MSAVRASGLARRVGWPAMSTAAGSLKECLLNVPATEVSEQKVVVETPPPPQVFSQGADPHPPPPPLPLREAGHVHGCRLAQGVSTQRSRHRGQ